MRLRIESLSEFSSGHMSTKVNMDNVPWENYLENNNSFIQSHEWLYKQQFVPRDFAKCRNNT